MPINQGLSHLSDHFLTATLVLYFLAVLAFAADFAFGRRSTYPAAGAGRAELVPAGAATAGGQAATAAGTGVLPPAGAAGVAPAREEPGGGRPGGGEPVPGQPAGGRPGGGQVGSGQVGGGQLGSGQLGGGTGRRLWDALPAGRWVRAGLALTVLGLAAHILGVITRGLAVHRVPWGDMYEFVIAVSCVAVIFFVGLMIRYRPYYLGLFVMAPIVIIIGLAQTVIYTPAGPIAVALNSYWLAIHVTAITLATGTYVVAAALAVVYLFADRHNRRVAAGLPVRNSEIFQLLPSAERIDQLAYRTVVFAFPLWTFGIMAGAIWADQAWGRYWGWDPTETWAFITWVVYACFLHARVTAGWRGRRAACIQLVGFGCLLFNVLGVSLFITGLHSYAGLN